MNGKGPDEIFCESCGEIIKEMAEVCPHCGVRNKHQSGTVGGTGTATTGGDDPHSDGIFEFSLKYPLSNDLMPIVMGTILLFFFWLLIPIFLFSGYTYRVGRAAARGDDAIPDYDDWGALLKNGLLLFVVNLPYAILVTVGTVGVILVAIQLEGGAALALLLLAMVLFVPIAYVGGAILPTFLATGSVTETYRDLRFLKVALTKEYLVGFAVLFVLSTVVSTAVGMISMILAITFIGLILAIPLYLALTPYLAYLNSALWGYVIWDADDDVPLPTVHQHDDLDAEF